MKNLNLISGLIFILFLGCQVVEEDPPEEVLNIGQMELYTPDGYLSNVLYYQGNSTEYSGNSHVYYDEMDREVLRVGVDFAGDTTGVSHYLYDEADKILHKFSYTHIEAKLEMEAFSEYFYDEEGRLSHVLAYSPEGEMSFRYRNIYNEKGELVEVQFTEGGSEYVAYSYDENGKITNEVHFVEWDQAWMEYFYRYDENGLLVAKETDRDVSPEVGRKDAFQYEYDEQGRLVEEREYLPSYDFVLRNRLVYQYY